MSCWWVLLICLAKLGTASTGQLVVEMEKYQDDLDKLSVVGFRFEGGAHADELALQASIQNRPGRYLNIEVCSPWNNTAVNPVMLEVLLAKGYKFAGEDNEECYGYSAQETSTRQANETNALKQFSDEVLTKGFLEGLSLQARDMLKVRPTDSYSVKLFPNGSISIECVFVHHRPLQKELPNVEFITRNQSTLARYALKQNRLQLASTEELSPYISFNRTLRGKGLHQTLVYFIRMPPGVDIHEDCSLRIADQLTEDFYLDANQFSNLDHMEVLDVELPAYMSKQYWYTLNYNLSGFSKTVEGYSFEHPVHFRYQRPSNTSEFHQVFVPEARQLSITCNDVTYRLKEQYNPNHLSTKIPVGLKQSERTVIFVTLVATLCCALFINKSLRKRKFV